MELEKSLLKRTLTMERDKGISEVRNHYLSRRKDNKRVSSGTKVKHKSVNHLNSPVTTEEHPTGALHSSVSVKNTYEASNVNSISDVSKEQPYSYSNDQIGDVLDIDSDTVITNSHVAATRRHTICVDLRFDNGLEDNTDVDSRAKEETITIDNEGIPLKCDNTTQDPTRTQSNKCGSKSIVRQDSLCAITEEKEANKSSNLVDKKETFRREITFDDLTLDDGDILRTSTPTGDPSLRKRPCSSHRVSAAGAKPRTSKRPISSFTPRDRQEPGLRRPATACRFHDFVNRPSTSRSRGYHSARSNRPSTSVTNMSSSPRRSIDSKKDFKITKEDLATYLPKKSFFNCHDKVLKDAGFEVEEVSPAGAKKKAFMQLLQQRNKDRIEKDKARHIPPPKVLGLLDLYELEISGEDPHNHSVVSFEDQQPNSKNKRNTKQASKKKNDQDEDEIRVDYQLLLIYLRYVNGNPEEYLQHHNQLSASENLVNVRQGDSLIKMGGIFQRGRHGISTENILVTAVHDIRPRFTDPGQWSIANKEKELLALTSTKKDVSNFPTKPDPSKKDAKKEATQDEPQTEYDRIKVKLDGWLKTVTTAQLNKAKELALKELGQEDISLSRWWLSLKSCNYIRQRRS